MEHLATKEDIQTFRSWLDKVPYLDQDVDDSVLAAFYQGSKGRMEKAKSTFDCFHNVPIKFPEMFLNCDPLDLQTKNNQKAGYLGVSPNLTEDGCAVVFAALVNPDVNLFNLNAYHRTLQTILLLILLDPKYHIKFGEKWSGKVLYVVDAKLNTVHHYGYTPMMLKGLVEYMSSSVPLRFAGIHNINASSFSERFFGLLKPFLKKKLANRIHLHSSPDAIFKTLPKNVLPKEMGGTLDFVACAQKVIDDSEAFRPTLLAWREKIKALDQKRPKTQEDIVVGTFKKLQVCESVLDTYEMSKLVSKTDKKKVSFLLAQLFIVLMDFNYQKRLCDIETRRQSEGGLMESGTTVMTHIFWKLIKIVEV